MAVPQPQSEVPSTQAPLIPEEHSFDTQFSLSLRRLEFFLRFFGFCQFSVLSVALSWVSFFLVGVALQFIKIELSSCSGCERYQIKSFELEILVSESLVAAISLLCISLNFRKHGVRKFLFFDRCNGEMTQFHEEYTRKINDFFYLLVVWLVPCFFLKAVREIIHIVYVHPHSWWLSAAILFASLLSWTYSAIIYLSGSTVFHLVCNLLVIHLENFGKLLERDLDVSAYIEEHVLLTHHISKISHRFRIFLLLEFLVVTASQCIALLETTGNRGIINFINGGDFAVASIYELVGIVISLHAAAKISHRAQGLASVASRWHALVTCSATSADINGSQSDGNLAAAAFTASSLQITYSESDLESVDYVPVPTVSQLASFTSLYHKRQAFVTYLQSNPRGVTIFGWTIDRTLINTIFFVELSLVLFVLGKTITF